MGTSYKAYWLTDIPTKRFAEVAVNSLNRFGWKIGMVNDELGSVTANKNDSKDIMGKWWKFEFRVGLRWLSLEEEIATARESHKQVTKSFEDVLCDIRQSVFNLEISDTDDSTGLNQSSGAAWWDVDTKPKSTGGLTAPSFLDDNFASAPASKPITAVNKPMANSAIPDNVCLVGAEGTIGPVSAKNTSWTEEEAAKFKDGCLVEIEVSEDQFGWSDQECEDWFKKLVEATWVDGRKYVRENLKSKNTGARWATVDELNKQGYLGDKPEQRSLLITKHKDTGSWFRLSEPDTNRHALVCGPTGTGKTSSIFVPNLIERIAVSAIVTEATGSKGRADLYSKTSGYREKVGKQKIFYFNPDDMTSHRINPLDQVNSYSEARRITEIIMQSTTLSSHKGDQTWDMAERLLLTSVILHAVGEREDTSISPYGNCNLSYVVKLLNKGAEELGKILADSNIEEAQESYQGFLNNSSENYRNLVAGGLITRLDLWKDPKIKVLTETTDINFETLADELFTWYLATPADQPELKPLAALVFNIALKVIGNSNFKHPVMLMLDEFTNFGYVRGMPAKLSIIRHDKIPCVLGIQDYIQLKNLYHDEAPLFLSQPGTRIFFRPNDLETAERISKGLGEVREVMRRIESSGAIREEKDKFFLLSLDDLVNLDKDKLIAFTPSTRPNLTQFLGWEVYAEQTNEQKYPPPARTPHHVVTGLTDRRKKEKAPDQSEPNKESVEEKKPAASTLLKKPSLPSNPLLWAKEIKVEWPEPDGMKAYNPSSSLEDLEMLVFAYEDKDPSALKAMTEQDYLRVMDWIEKKETGEQHGELLDEDEVEIRRKQIEELKAEQAKKQESQSSIFETQEKDKDDEFRGAW